MPTSTTPWKRRTVAWLVHQMAHGPLQGNLSRRFHAAHWVRENATELLVGASSTKGSRVKDAALDEHKDDHRYHEVSAGSCSARASCDTLTSSKTLGHKVKWPRASIITMWQGYFFLLIQCFSQIKWQLIIDLTTVLVKTDCLCVSFLVPLDIQICYPFQLYLGPKICFLELSLVIKEGKICYYISEIISFFYKVWGLLLKIKGATGIILWSFKWECEF